MANTRTPDASVTLDHPLSAVAINPATDTDLTAAFAQGYAREIYVGGTGDVKVDFWNSTGNVFKAVPVGTTIKGVFKKVYSTANGTSATNLLAKE